ncbi:hypothetical protein TI39_contig291g00029 [Zymoseptoria brevis]|uniref:Uncharacterized protein n=1 Tax=Zymoseptoria brevis TaxID=1047168 RepID=A0A0F4GWN8_9PEZI|nr:hypothetical protein TI39_contig291g00029 [Zymoseptoria brevis]
MPSGSNTDPPDAPPPQERIDEYRQSDFAQTPSQSSDRRSLQDPPGPRMSGRDLARAYLRKRGERMVGKFALLRAENAKQAQKIDQLQRELAASEHILTERDRCIEKLRMEINLLGGVASGRWRERQELRSKLTETMVKQAVAQSEADQLRARLAANDKKMREMQKELHELAAALKASKQ